MAPRPWSATALAAVFVFAAATAVAAGWTLLLASVLDGAAWRMWVGYDLALTVALATATWCARRRDPRLPLLCGLVAALVAADCWFDLTTAPPSYLPWSVLSAAVLEGPFVLVCLAFGVVLSRWWPGSAGALPWRRPGAAASTPR